MKFWFRGHHYKTQFMHSLSTFLHWWSIEGFIKAQLHGEQWFIFFGHEDDCCDYWTPVSDPKAQKALMLDDDFKLTKSTPKTEDKL